MHMEYLIYIIIFFWGLNRLSSFFKKRTLKRFIIFTKISIFNIEKGIDKINNIKLCRLFYNLIWLLLLTINSIIFYFSILGVKNYFD